jgi:hypothetical protein
MSEKKSLTKGEKSITYGAESYIDISITRTEKGGDDFILITSGDRTIRDQGVMGEGPRIIRCQKVRRFSIHWKSNLVKNRNLLWR